jgi:uncharacterized membrane protein
VLKKAGVKGGQGVRVGVVLAKTQYRMSNAAVSSSMDLSRCHWMTEGIVRPIREIEYDVAEKLRV